MKYLLSFCLCFFIGCGYKPSSYYAKDAITGDVYVELKVDINNTQNSVFVKDAMNEMIINQFKANLTDNKKTANTQVMLVLQSVNHIAISSDNDGYAHSYRTIVKIKMTYKKANRSPKTILVSNYYDYTVDNDSVITEQKKKISIKKASMKALSNIFSKIAVNSMRE